MPNSLSLTDGTTTISLSSSGCMLTRYVPTAGAIATGGGENALTETAEFVITGDTTALVQEKLNAIERTLAQAVERGGFTSHRAYLLFQAHGDTYAWRSEIVGYRLMLDDDFAVEFVQQMLGCRLIITRSAWWETVDELNAGAVHVLNGDGSIDEQGMWIGPGGPVTYDGSVALGEGDNARNAGEWATIAGVLPTPAHVTITNESGGAITMRRALLANDVYARFSGAEHLIQSGAAVSWTGASAHSTARWTLALTATQIAKAQAAGGLRLLGAFTAADAGLYLRATLYHVASGPVLTEAWRGPEVLTGATRKVYDLGFVSFPPDVDATFADLYLIISIYATATGGATLDFVQLCPGRELITLEGAALSWSNAAEMDWYGDRRYGQMSDYHASITASGRLMLQPSRENRLMVLIEGVSGVDSTARLQVGVRYRPRRATI